MGDLLPLDYLEGLIGRRVTIRSQTHGAREYTGKLLLYVTDHPDERRGFQNGLLVLLEDRNLNVMTFDASKTPYVAPAEDDDTGPVKKKTFHLPGNGKVVVMIGTATKQKS